MIKTGDSVIIKNSINAHWAEVLRSIQPFLVFSAKDKDGCVVLHITPFQEQKIKESDNKELKNFLHTGQISASHLLNVPLYVKFEKFYDEQI